jgi:type II secretory pathway pseudopilin PulG
MPTRHSTPPPLAAAHRASPPSVRAHEAPSRPALSDAAPCDVAPRRAAARDGRDAGFTVVELVVSISITGIMLAAISMALLFVLNSTERAEASVSQARDVSFIQTWVPIDLASAISTNSDPSTDPSSGDVLPGVNIMTIERANLTNPGQPNYFVSYRYTSGADGWDIVRYEVRNPGTGSEDVFRVRIASEVEPPPPGWDPSTFPDHAVAVTVRNPAPLRPAGTDIEITFDDGSTYTIGGAGLGAGSVLPPNSAGGFVDPAAPPSRCGGDFALVLDSSGSIGSNMHQVEDAAKEIIANFQGTPSTFRIIDFDTNAAPVDPATWDGAPIDMLTLTNGDRNALDNRIDSALSSGGWTNWEAALRMAITDWPRFAELVPGPNLPSVVIFVTDGDPTIYLSNSGSTVRPPTYDESHAAALPVADMRGAWGIEFKGIFIQPGGATAISPESQARLKDIVGSTEWVRDGSDPVGNADVASFFMGDPSELGAIFQHLFVADCGGTVTLQKRIDTGSGEVAPSSGTWTYSSSGGVRDLNAAVTPSVTFDFVTGTSESWEPILEDQVPGRTLTDVRCSVRGTDVTADRVRPLVDTDGSPLSNGREVRIVPNEALSCVFVST